MQSETANIVATTSPSDFRPEPERLDFSSVKVQMSCGLVLIFFACLVGYWNSLKIGFLLDDYLHIDYAAKAVAGQWGALTGNMTGNWAGSDIMKSYRPVTSLSIFLDYVLWGVNGFGFHLTNVLLFFGCCVFVSLITLELTGRYGNRLGAAPAIWAGLLFAVYPLHPEAVAWIIGRVDLLCGFFYLASVFCYLRFRLLKETDYLKWSLCLFLLSLLSKEMAVTLPAVITLAELCLWGRPAERTAASSPPGQRVALESLTARVKFVAAFWIVLAAYAVFRGLILGTFVGGYGSSGPLEILKSWRTFLDRPTLAQVIFPANEEVKAPAIIRPLLISCYLTALALLGSRLALRSARPGPLLFLAGWTIVAVLPTFQIWHVYPNLVGSRLFFLSSAPLCIWLVLAALPALDAIKRRSALVLCGLAALALLLTFLVWAELLQINMQPWRTAGKIMSDLRRQVSDIATSVPPGKRLLLLNLPTDYSGAGLVTRPQYLEILSDRPFAPVSRADRLLTIEPPVSGSHEFMWPQQFKRMLNNANLAGVLKWSPSQRRFVPWQQGTGSDRYSFSVEADGSSSIFIAAHVGSSDRFSGGDRKNAITAVKPDPADTIVTSGERWTVMSAKSACIEQHPGFLRIFPGPNGVTVFLPPARLNPLECSVATVDMVARSSNGCTQCFGGGVELVWESQPEHAESEPAAGTGEPARAAVREGSPGHYIVPLGRVRRWTLSGQVSRVGLRVNPGDVFVDLSGIKIGTEGSIVPSLEWDRSSGNQAHRDDPANLWMVKTESGKAPDLRYDTSNIPGAQSVRLLVTEDGTTFDALSDFDIGRPYTPNGDPTRLYKLEQKGASGRIMLPAQAISSPGLHQARAIALDRAGLAVGLPSDPVSILVTPDR